MQSFLLMAWNTWCELAPWMLLGMALAGLLHVLVPVGYFERSFRGWWGVVKAVALGVPLPLCSCGVIPAGIGLKRQGASDGAAMGFLISTPQTGVDSILVSASFLGWPFALLKMAAALVTGVLGGWVVEWTSRPAPNERHSMAPQLPQKKKSLVDLFRHAWEILSSIWIWLVIGVLISAAINLWMPRSWGETVSHWGTLPAMILVLAISLPWYICATASIPVAASLVSSGFPMGAAMVFLMAGPATNIATMGSIVAAFGWRVFVSYLAIIVAGSMTAGLLFENWVGALGPNPRAVEHQHPTGIEISSAAGAVLLALIAVLAWQRLERTMRRRKPANKDSRIVALTVGGMNCQNCVDQLESALRRAGHVDRVLVDLASGSTLVEGSLTGEQVNAAVRHCGYRVVESQ